MIQIFTNGLELEHFNNILYYIPIKPPMRKQTICATIKSTTSTDSFLPLKFSIIVPCIFPRLLLKLVPHHTMINDERKLEERRIFQPLSISTPKNRPGTRRANKL